MSSVKCFNEFMPELTKTFQEKTKGMSEADARNEAINMVLDEHEKLHNSLEAFKKSISADPSKYKPQKYIRPTTVEDLKKINESYNKQVEDKKKELASLSLSKKDKVVGEHKGIKILDTKDAQKFHDAIKGAIMMRQSDRFQADVHPVEYYQEILDTGGKLYLAENGMFGAFVQVNGYMGSLFKNPNADTTGVAKVLQRIRTENGGKFFDAYGTHLEKMYVKNGFRPVARLKFNEEYAPEGWQDSNLKDKPDVVFFVYDPNADFKVGEGDYFDDWDKAYIFAKNYETTNTTAGEGANGTVQKTVSNSQNVSQEGNQAGTKTGQEGTQVVPPDIKAQIENFGVPKPEVEPVHSLLDKVFQGLKKAGLTAADNLSEWVNIGQGSKTKTALYQPTVFGESGIVKKPSFDKPTYIKAIKEKRIQIKTPQESLGNKFFAITHPDDLFAGSMVINGKKVADFGGGVGYSIERGADGDMWASVGEKAAKNFATQVNNSLSKNGDEGIVILAKGSDIKHATSLAAKVGFINTLLAYGENKKGYEGLINAIKSVYSIGNAKDAGKVMALFNNYLKGGRMEDGQLMTEAKASYENFRSALKNEANPLITQMMRDMGYDGVEYFDAGQLKKGVYKATGRGIDLMFADMQQEDMLKGVPSGAAYAALKTTRKVEAFRDDSHPSYPWGIRTVDGTPVKLDIFDKTFMTYGEDQAIIGRDPKEGQQATNSLGQVTTTVPKYQLDPNANFNSSSSKDQTGVLNTYEAVKGASALNQGQNAQYRVESGKNIIEAIRSFNKADDKGKATVALTHEIMHPAVVEIINGAEDGVEAGVKYTQTIVSEYNKATGENITMEQLIADNSKFQVGTTTDQYRAVQEFIAESWEKYHTQGPQGFTAAFQKVLDQITSVFKSVYSTLSGKDISPELKNMFDEILGKPGTMTEKTYSQKSKEIADKIRNAELPQWLVNTNPNIKASGITGQSLKNALANSVELVGQLLDKGVELKEAISQGVASLKKFYIDNNAPYDEKSLADGFEQYVKDQLPTKETIKSIADQIRNDEISYNDAIEGKSENFIKDLSNELFGSRKFSFDPDSFKEQVRRQKTMGLTQEEVVQLFESSKKLTRDQRRFIDEVYASDAATDRIAAELQEAFKQIAKGEKPKAVLQRLSVSNVRSLVVALKDALTYKAVSNEQLEKMVDYVVSTIDLKKADQVVDSIINNQASDMKQLLRAKLIVALQKEGNIKMAKQLAKDMSEEAVMTGRQTQSLKRAYEILGAQGSATMKTEFARRAAEAVQKKAMEMTARYAEVISEKNAEISKLNERIHQKAQSSPLMDKIKDVISNLCGLRNKK